MTTELKNAAAMRVSRQMSLEILEARRRRDPLRRDREDLRLRFERRNRQPVQRQQRNRAPPIASTMKPPRA
jgi:hypothetical protein